MADDSSEIEDERTLANIIAEKGVLSITDAAAVTLQLVTVVSNLHAEGKVHRQICPNTVGLDESMSATLGSIEPKVTLGGIGIDLIPSPPQLHNVSPLSLPAEIKAAQHILTEAGILLDPRQIDFYQLGALLCFMVSCHSIPDYLRSCKAKADVSAAIRPIIDRALGMNAKDQFESAEAFLSELEAVISGKPAAEDRSGLPDSIFIEPSSKPETEDRLPFEKLGHYEIIERIGRGGMGDVYKGYEKTLDRFVAIKVLPAQLARQEDFVKRFHAEATAIAKIDHPNIVRIYYSGQDQGHHFFAMQYVDGESLADLLTARKKLTAAESLPVIVQCLAGIGAAHERGLIHRDIKPGNVLLDRHSRRALVTDFGVVKSAHADTHITVTGTIMGTADYIAPEQARGSDIDCRADLYAIGILMYQMLGGKLPFDATSATSMMFQHAYEPPPPLSEVAPEVPEKLARIVMKLMSKNPEDRFSCADDILAELQDIDLQVAGHGGKSQTSIIRTPQFYSDPELPGELMKLTGSNWFARLRNRIADFFGTHAAQIIEHIQTTGQQVDGAVSEYQRRRNRLAELAREAKTVATDLEGQAKASRAAAQSAGRRVEAAANETAINHALKEKQESEQAAAELAQLAAEQAQQAEEMDLRLAKVDAQLLRLRSQRDALNARMNAAGAHLRPASNRLGRFLRPRKLLLAGLAVIIAVLVSLVFLKMTPPLPPLAIPSDDSPVVFAGNLPVDGIVVRQSQCTAQFVESLLGKPRKKDGSMLRYTDSGIDFCFPRNGPLAEIHLNRGFKGKLDTGISLTSTKQDVFGAYGEPVEIIRTANLHRAKGERVLRQNGNTSRIYYGKVGLIFWFRGDSVNQIVVFKGRMKRSGSIRTALPAREARQLYIPWPGFEGIWYHSHTFAGKKRTHVLRCSKDNTGRLRFDFLKQYYSYEPIFTECSVHDSQIEMKFKLAFSTSYPGGRHSIKYILKSEEGSLVGQLYDSWGEPVDVTLTRQEPNR